MKPIKIFAISMKDSKYWLETDKKVVEANLKVAPDGRWGFTTPINPERWIIPLEKGLWWLPEGQAIQNEGFCGTITEYELFQNSKA